MSIDKPTGQLSGASAVKRRSVGGPFPLHPLLIGLFPVMSLLASNIGDLPVSQAVRPGLIVLVATGLLLLVMALSLRDWRRAGLLTSTGLVWFFAYGHMYIVALAAVFIFTREALPWISGNSLALALHVPAFLAWSGLTLGLVRSILRRSPPPALTGSLNLVALVLVLWPTFEVVRGETSIQPPRTQASAAGTIPSPQDRPEAILPDIYYIVLDGYGRKDILQSIYGIDSEPFLGFLRSNGFVVAAESRSNYAQTILSLASSLNMEYLPADLQPGSDVNVLVPLFRDSAVRRALEEQGYVTVAFSTGYGRTEIPDADVYLRPGGLQAGTLEALLSQTSVLSVAESVSSVLGLPYPYPGYDEHRARVLYTLAQLPTVARMPGPKFVFAHFLVPHPPFVFDAQGNPVPQNHAYGLRDGSDFQGTRDAYVQGYVGQLQFITVAIEEAISGILDNSASSPVIVLQGDHGPGSLLDWRDPSPEALQERFAILNAYRLPGPLASRPESSITPVNSFRLILNAYLGAEMPLLPEQSFFSPASDPFRLVHVP